MSTRAWEQQLADLRPVLTNALHTLKPEVPLIDCARVANKVLDAAADGDYEGVRLMLVSLKAALAGQMEQVDALLMVGGRR